MRNHFLADGHKIAYGDFGNGDPIILLHGFATDSWMNWHATGWRRLLLDSGFRVITMDSRGHGTAISRRQRRPMRQRARRKT